MEVSKAGLQENAKIIPFVVYQPFAPHGISPWVAQAMKRASSQ
jgi:hypothetical protein